MLVWEFISFQFFYNCVNSHVYRDAGEQRLSSEYISMKLTDLIEFMI